MCLVHVCFFTRNIIEDMLPGLQPRWALSLLCWGGRKKHRADLGLEERRGNRGNARGDRTHPRLPFQSLSGKSCVSGTISALERVTTESFAAAKRRVKAQGLCSRQAKLDGY